MKCGRCNIELGSANKKNAYYITNINDEKTFGDTEVDEFSLIKADESIEISYCFVSLQEKQKSENILIDSNISSKQDEIDIIKVNIDEEEDVDLKAQLLTSYETKLNELSVLSSKKQQIHIESKVVIKSVPKTLIICKDCKQDSDTILW